MAHPLVSFVGRDAELAAISLAIQEADQGRGGSWLLSGAPGIGKSRLAEEVARSATDAGFVVGWGRCWESGGAPAFWPWIQSLRALYRCSDAGALSPDIRERLLPLLPELAPYATEATPASGRGLEDRFELLDEVTSAICALAVSRPLLIILDDLHAADHSSLALLDFASRQLYASRVVVLGTFRAHDAQRSQHAALIARIAQDANTIPLGPLDTVALEAYLADAAGGVINASLAASLHARTEGNPLFMVELVRLIASDPTMTAETLVQTSLPPGLEQALRAHVGALSSSSRAVLEMAAIIGREFGTEALARHFEIPFDRAHAAVGEAVALGLLQVAGDDYYRFCHILLRDVLEGDADEMHRKALHRRFAESLATRHEGRDPRWSEIAHHFELAGHACRTQTVDALTRAGESATSKLAFEDAAIVYRRGLLLLDRAGSDDKGQRAELLIGLCRALVGAGQREAGRECCREAAALARELKDATLLARACLEFGSILVFGNVDPHLIVMLQEALDALPPGDGSLRAHVQARLAAAMQPATDPSVPIELAIDAIGMARRLEEPVTMLAVLRSGCSAMVDMAPPEVRLPFDREHATRATELGAKRDALLAQTRLIFDCIQLADRLGADAAVRAATALILQIDHRSVAWLLPGMEAMRQLWDGALQAALDSCARAAALGERSGNPNARATTLYQRYRILRMLGRNEEVIAGMTEMQGLFRGTPVMENYMQIIVAGNLLDVGQRDAALRCFNEDAVSAGMAMGEPSILEPLAELGLATGDKSLATAIRDRVASVPEHLIGGGPLTLTWDSPVHRVLALTNQTLGDNDAAVRHYEAGAALARRLGGEPIATRMRTELGEFLCSIERRDDARSVLATAAEDAASMSMAAIAQRARAALEALDTPRKVAPMAPVTEPLCFDPEGHVWRVRYQARELRIKDSKGVRFVASLVSQPRKAMHVLDLAAPSARHEVDDEGAEILDATARDAYKARIEVLRDQLDEAEGFNDPGRAATARAEMDTLVTELSKGLGLSGRGRQFSTNAERARVNVQRRIRDAIRRIGELDKPLARHLDRCIRTGTHCSYDPE